MTWRMNEWVGGEQTEVTQEFSSDSKFILSKVMYKSSPQRTVKKNHRS